MFNYRNDTQMAYVFGGLFLLVAAIGFVPNPLLSEHGYFAVNAAHNIFHALVGAGLIIAGKFWQGQRALLIAGIMYIIIAILGYLMMSEMMFGMVRVNMADHYLHILLGIGLIIAGVMTKPVKG